MTAPLQFTCGNCGRDVPFMDAGLLTWDARNQCPHCLWSKHVMFGCPGRLPCDAMMRPVARSARTVVQQCEDCGFRWVSYDEDWWAAQDTGLQVKMINLAFTASGQLNGAPVTVFGIRPEYRVRIIKIPRSQLGTRTRSVRRLRTAGNPFTTLSVAVS